MEPQRREKKTRKEKNIKKKQMKNKKHRKYQGKELISLNWVKQQRIKHRRREKEKVLQNDRQKLTSKGGNCREWLQLEKETRKKEPKTKKERFGKGWQEKKAELKRQYSWPSRVEMRAKILTSSNKWEEKTKSAKYFSKL